MANAAEEGRVFSDLRPPEKSLSSLKGFYPGMLVSSIGLACVIVAQQSMRITTLTGIYPVDATLLLRHLSSCLALVILFAILRKHPGIRLSSKSMAVAAVGIAATCSLLMKYSSFIFGLDSAIVENIGRILEEPLLYVLFAMLSERVLEKGLASSLCTFAVALLMVAGVQFFFSFLQRVPCMCALSMIPLAAVVANTNADQRCREHTPEQQTVKSGSLETSQRDLAAQPEKMAFATCLGIVFFAMLLTGNVLFESLDTQQATASSPYAQLCIIAGNALAGALLAALCQQIDAKPALQAFALGLFALCAVSLYLTTFMFDQAIGVYLVLSSIALQSSTFMIFLTAILTRGAQSISCSASFCLAYAVAMAAKLVSAACMYIELWKNLPAFNIVGSVSLIALFIFCAIFSFGSNIDTVVNGLPKTRASTEDAARQETSLESAVERIAQRRLLTSQEAKVLLLLARGRNAGSISNELVVSVNTAKTHMRNIYAKLDVHSQQDLISLVDAEKAGKVSPSAHDETTRNAD